MRDQIQIFIQNLGPMEQFNLNISILLLFLFFRIILKFLVYNQNHVHNKYKIFLTNLFKE